jgi:hypothetical protein
MNPFNFWLPLPLLRLSDNGDISLDGGGIFSVMMDPTDRNTIILMAYVDTTYRMSMIESFIWQSTIPGFPLTLEVSDMVNLINNSIPYRDTRITLTGSLIHYPGRWGYNLNFGTGFFRIAGNTNPGSHSAYEWEELGSAFLLSTGFSIFSNQRRSNELFGTGMSLSLRGASVLETFNPRIEGIFRLNAEKRFPLNLTLYSAYDKIGMNLHGISRSYGQSIFAGAASREYPSFNGFNHSWLAGGEVSLGLFSIEIQNHISHIYFNRLFCTLTLRNVIYDNKGRPDAPGIIVHENINLAQSLVLSLKLISSFLPIQYVPFFIEPQIWAAWKFSNTITGEGYPWAYGLTFSYRY